MSKKIVIEKCTACPYIEHRGGFGNIMYKPFCSEVSCDLPFTVSVQQGNNVIATPTGFVNKTNPYSEQVTDKTISRLVDNARSGASFIEDSLKNYLNRKNSDYPLWLSCEKTTNFRTRIRQV